MLTRNMHVSRIQRILVLPYDNNLEQIYYH